MIPRNYSDLRDSLNSIFKKYREIQIEKQCEEEKMKRSLCEEEKKRTFLYSHSFPPCCASVLIFTCKGVWCLNFMKL